MPLPATYHILTQHHNVLDHHRFSQESPSSSLVIGPRGHEPSKVQLCRPSNTTVISWGFPRHFRGEQHNIFGPLN